MFPVVFFLAAIIGATLHLFIRKKPRKTQRIIGIYLLYLIVCSIGLQGIYAWYGHTFLATQVAAQIGWPNSPFQFEVAMANFSLGILGILSIWFGKEFKLATVIGYCIFIYGAAYQHFVQIANGDHAQYNSGIFLYMGDIVIPTVILLLMFIYYHTSRTKSISSDKK